MKTWQTDTLSAGWFALSNAHLYLYRVSGIGYRVSGITYHLSPISIGYRVSVSGQGYDYGLSVSGQVARAYPSAVSGQGGLPVSGQRVSGVKGLPVSGQGEPSRVRASRQQAEPLRSARHRASRQNENGLAVRGITASPFDG